jgi:hypothetical protein
MDNRFPHYWVGLAESSYLEFLLRILDSEYGLF